MQKIVQSLPILVVAVAVGIIAYQIAEHRRIKAESKPEIPVAEKVAAAQLPVATNLPESDRQLVSKAFASPETLDSSVTVQTSNSVARPAERPVLLSEIEPVKPPVATNSATGGQDAYFQKDFESLRTDAIRNPDSPENRATVTALMLKRQQRLGQK